VYGVHGTGKLDVVLKFRTSLLHCTGNTLPLPIKNAQNSFAVKTGYLSAFELHIRGSKERMIDHIHLAVNYEFENKLQRGTGHRYHKIKCTQVNQSLS